MDLHDGGLAPGTLPAAYCGDDWTAQALTIVKISMDCALTHMLPRMAICFSNPKRKAAFCFPVQAKCSLLCWLGWGGMAYSCHGSAPSKSDSDSAGGG
eukprot:364443-Chlamydomonas_euryale.AAC.23